jgi:Asp-tRNA(Asn)/Glu-tRNA(Gln) amidotransferase A subunit family amidase
MARRVADVAIVFDAIAGHDAHDPTSLAESSPNAAGRLDEGVKSLRIGIDRRYALEGIDSGDAAALEEALRVLADLGARIVEVRMPDLALRHEALLAVRAGADRLAGANCRGVSCSCRHGSSSCQTLLVCMDNATAVGHRAVLPPADAAGWPLHARRSRPRCARQ